VTVGISGHSIALVADAVHTLSDAFTSGAVWLGLKVARRPADETHPYGHGKAEPIAGKAVAIALFIVGAGIAYRSVDGIVLHAVGKGELTAPSALTLYAALLSIFVKELLYQYQIRVARKIDSVALMADAWHHRSDALSSVAVSVGIAAAALGGPRWHWADEAAALVVAVFIIWVAWDLFKRSAAGLMDTLAPREVEDEIRSAALSVEGVLAVEKTFARRSGLDILVDIHVEVDPQMTVEMGHEIATAVTKRLTETIPQVTHALVHIEPFSEDDDHSATGA
jgi:cation diffusion facilitator family transporter